MENNFYCLKTRRPTSKDNKRSSYQYRDLYILPCYNPLPTPKYKPTKKSFKKHKLTGLFSRFYSKSKKELKLSQYGKCINPGYKTKIIKL